MSQSTTDTGAAKTVSQFASFAESFMGDWVMYKDIWTGKIRF